MVLQVGAKFQCQVCQQTWPLEPFATLCENSELAPCRAKANEEVRLINRNVGFTLAKVVKARIQSNKILDFVEENPQEWLKRFSNPEAKDFLANLEWHHWVIELDRPVFLDHKWGGPLTTISDFYVLSDEEVAGIGGRPWIRRGAMTRADNLNW